MKRHKRSKQSGVALIFVLLTLILLAAIAATLIMASNTETSVNANYKAEEQAYYAAHAGVEEVRDRLRQNFGAASLSAFLPQVTPGNVGGVLYVINQGADPVAVQPWTAATPYMDDELCHEGYVIGGMQNLPSGSGIRCGTVPTAGGWYVIPAPVSTAPGSGTAAAIPYKWVRVNWKENCSAGFCVDGTQPATTPVCFDGSKEILLVGATCALMNAVQPPENVYMVTALAVTPSGARRILQSEIAKVLFPPTPAALTFAGPNPTFGGPNSNPFKINGNDQAVPACVPGGNKPAIGGYDNTAVTDIQNGIPNNRTGNYTGSPTAEGNVGSTGTNTLGPWGNVTQLNQIVVNIESQASQTVAVGSSTLPLGTLGTDANPLITVVKGDITLSGATRGAGVLLVEGTLTLSGNSGFDGVVLVIGSGVLNNNGGGSGQFNGSVLVANTKTGVVGNTPGPPTVNWAGGGGNGIYWNSCDANLLNNTVYYHTIAWHEVSY